MATRDCRRASGEQAQETGIFAVAFTSTLLPSESRPNQEQSLNAGKRLTGSLPMIPEQHCASIITACRRRFKARKAAAWPLRRVNGP
jgi:hypothetical protein